MQSWPYTLPASAYPAYSTVNKSIIGVPVLNKSIIGVSVLNKKIIGVPVLNKSIIGVPVFKSSALITNYEIRTVYLFRKKGQWEVPNSLLHIVIGKQNSRGQDWADVSTSV